MTSPSRSDLPLTQQERQEAFSEIKALRERRIAEKAELQDLNTRLEIVLNHLDVRDRRIADLVAERDQLQDELNGRSTTWSKKLEAAAKKWELDATRIKGENRELGQKATALRTENERLKFELAAANDRVKELEAVIPQIDKLQSRLDVQSEKSLIEIEQLRTDLENRDRVMKEREEKALAREAKLKSDLEEQRLIDIRAVEERCEMDRNQQIEKFRQDWNRQTQEKDRLINQLKNECGNLREELAARNKEMTQLEKQLRDAMQRFEDSQRNRDKVRTETDVELSRMRREIQEMSNAFARKNLQFDELMEEKIALQQEIEMYRKLVSRAEQQNELQTPRPRKRYRPDTTLYSSAPQPSRRKAHLWFSSGNVEEAYFEISNNSNSTASLSGLYLRSSSGARMPLNAKHETLGGNSTLRVYLKPRRDMPADALLWDNAWDGRSKSEIKLINHQGERICGLTLDPAMFGDEHQSDACFVM